jgi:hypothetical protein
MPIVKVNQIASYTGNTLTVGTTGDTVTLASGATATGFGPTGAVTWSTTVRTAPFTAVSGNGYFVNTTSGAITVTLPATPSAGAIVGVADYAGTAATNNITIARNGSLIEGLSYNAGINVNRDTITFIYVDATQGWLAIADNTASTILPAFTTATGGTVTTCGNYKVHTFTSSGCFQVTQVGNGPVNPAGGPSTVSYLVVAGGGAGSVWSGAGAGGFREGRDTPTAYTTASPLVAPTGLTITQTTYPITVGAGGATGAIPGRYGNNSVFSTITSTGGGAGSCETSANGFSGGSGSGAAQTGTGGSGNTPPVSPSQGTSGSPNGSPASGGGGGGATTAGSGRSGGNGAATSIISSPTPVTYAGGGGGANRTSSAGTGGSGGGGNSGVYPYPGPQNTGTAGTANTGGGSGGGSDAIGGTGGSGIVVIRYKFQ